MNANILKGNWNVIKGELKKKWSKLSDSDLTSIDGDIDKLTGTLEKNYGYTKDRVAEMIADFQIKSEDTAEEGSVFLTQVREAASCVTKASENLIDNSKQVAQNLSDEACEYGKKVVNKIEKNPMQSLTFAALGGLILGLIFRKK